jgi:hypothetical protein
MTLQIIGIGLAANDGSGDPLRTAFDKCNDNFTEVYADIATAEALTSEYDNSYRCAINVGTVIGSQIIPFSAPFINADYLLEITDAGGVVTSLDAQSANGFTITCNSVGTIHYKATFIK